TEKGHGICRDLFRMENRIGPPSFDLHASKKVRRHRRLLMAFTLRSGFSAHGMILKMAAKE
ncbi:MAG: hypothetical protein E6413_05395, partial [Negativicoccus succinicivorans]|nr:hypothetical protein [Negativicoccus succinicivorans]